MEKTLSLTKSMAAAGAIAEPEIRAAAPLAHVRLPGLPTRFESAPYLNGSLLEFSGDAIYTASIQDAEAIWDLFLEDRDKNSFTPDWWAADLERAYGRLRKFVWARKAAGVADALLAPISWLFPCPAPCQQSLLEHHLGRAFTDTERFANMRDLGLALDSGVNKALETIRVALPSVLSRAQFSRKPLTPQDYQRAFGSFESFSATVRKWTMRDNPLSVALTQPDTLKWLYDHLMEVIRVFPERMLADGAFGKFCRSLFGVVAFKIAHLPKDISQTHLNREIFESVRAGLHFGRTYLYDDVLDSKDYPREEKERFLGAVADLLSGQPIDYAPSEPAARLVIESLVAFKTIFGEQLVRPIYNSYLALAHASVTEGRRKHDAVYSEKQIYGPLVVKAVYTRILPALMGRMPITNDFLAHAYLVAVHNQMEDDFKDVADDLASNTFTPYTHYVRGRSSNKDLRHPLTVYLHAISLIVRKLGDTPEVRRLWISGLIEGLRVVRFKGGRGTLRKFFEDHPTGHRRFEELLLKVSDVSEVALDPESIMAALASTTSMHVRGMKAVPVAGH
jgi:hypothetical protein